MKILWLGDAVATTGFARCTHAVCDALYSAGHEVSVLGMNYYGDPHNYPYDIYPCYQPLNAGRDVFGVARLPVMAERLAPDVIVVLQDPWNIDAYLKSLRGFQEQRAAQDIDFRSPPMVGWLAVDSVNQKGAELNGLDHVVVWTQFGADALKDGGYEGEPSVVPLGVDHDVFQPRDRAEARARLRQLGVDLPEGAFLIGAIGRNQPRKRLDLTIQYFAEWMLTRERDDAWLLLHVAPTGERGCDIVSLARHHGVSNRIIVSNPSVGSGFPEQEVATMYSAMDVYVSHSMGEGWGLPALEAMACGIPCIVPRFGGLASWADSAAVTVNCSGSGLVAPLNGTPYTVGGVMDGPDFADALDAMYNDLEPHRRLREKCSASGLELARTLSWKSTGQSFVRLLKGLLE